MDLWQTDGQSENTAQRLPSNESVILSPQDPSQLTPVQLRLLLLASPPSFFFDIAQLFSLQTILLSYGDRVNNGRRCDKKSACEMSGLQLPPCFYFFVFQFLRFLFCTTDETVKFLFKNRDLKNR